MLWLPPAKASPPDLWRSVADDGADWRWGGAPAERIALRIADWLKAAREALPVDAADAARGAAAVPGGRPHRAAHVPGASTSTGSATRRRRSTRRGS